MLPGLKWSRKRSLVPRLPTVFISSTVYDLGDIRSALHYFLTREGITVFMSEAPDFLVAANVHSYEACLMKARRADLLIALVWKRYGGLYLTEPDGRRVSVTLKEIREARD